MFGIIIDLLRGLRVEAFLGLTHIQGLYMDMWCLFQRP